MGGHAQVWPESPRDSPGEGGPNVPHSSCPTAKQKVMTEGEIAAREPPALKLVWSVSGQSITRVPCTEAKQVVATPHRSTRREVRANGTS